MTDALDLNNFIQVVLDLVRFALQKNLSTINGKIFYDFGSRHTFFLPQNCKICFLSSPERNSAEEKLG